MVDYWGRAVGSNVSSADFKNDINTYGDKV